ncbi:MAG TPA: hypothetical protein VFL83_06955 [Anaeromyxobacter sp.]|nr:hypothetical protein [Anaeromyxobacter sp.]
MLARLARDLPDRGWIHEAKGDGFRCVAFVEAPVAYDRLDGIRLRHPARLVRWRPDRDPGSCTLDQLRGFG